jgi:pimeloyl-ACP methyl ester carboxylesterase
MRPTVLSLVTSTRWVENTTRHLRSIAQRRTILSLMSLTLGGLVPLAMAQNATRPDLSTTSAAAVVHGHRVRNLVLVHGAWADGSGWRGVYDILVKDGFNVSIVQEPETSFQEDVTATKRVLALQDGPSILVAHSYGGSVVTEAGTDPSVAGLVYVAAHMPDAGESEAEDGKLFPSDLSKSTAIKETADGFEFLDPAQFREFFAADLPANFTTFEAHSQVLIAAANFSTPITTPAWRSKPSWVVVAGADRTINPDLERFYAARAKSHTIELQGASHSVYVSRPKEVAALVEEAASYAQ